MSLYSAGSDLHSRLGRHGNKKIPGIVPVDCHDFSCLACGWRHNIIIFKNGTALCWGDNSEFQLGLQDVTEVQTPSPLNILNGEPLSWAHCGDKSTTFLTKSGRVFVCGISTGRQMMELQIPKPAVFVTSGSKTSVVIDKDGALYCSDADNASIQRWEFDYPVCDAAAGSKFVLALTTRGQVYGLDDFAMEGTGSTTKFLPVPSLRDIQVSRVFAYNEHAAVITRDGRVMMCGNGERGRLGFGDNESRASFEFLTDLDDANIVEIDMGEESTIFIGHDGSLYGCGHSDDGCLLCAENCDFSVPTKSMHIPGRAVFVRCGCFHSLVVTDADRPKHPGLSYFNVPGHFVRIARTILIAKKEINASVTSLTMYNLLPGDSIGSDEFGEGHVIGVLSSNIICDFSGVIRQVRREDIKFISRIGYEGVTAKTADGDIVEFDKGKICSLFGFESGSTVYTRNNEKYTVLGYESGTIWFLDSNNVAYCLKDSSIRNLHSTFRLPESSNTRYVSTEIGEVPINVVPKYYVRCEGSVYCVTGAFANLLYVRFSDGSTKLMEKQKCRKLQSNDSFIEYDKVDYRGETGTVIGCTKSGVIFIGDNSTTAKMVSNSELSLLSRIAGYGERTISNKNYDVSYEGITNNVYPLDVYKTGSSIVTIVGRHSDKIYCEDEHGSIVEFVPEKEQTLLKRSFEYGEFHTQLRTRNDLLPKVNASFSSIASLNVAQCDEIQICGQNYNVCGVEDHHVWLLDTASEKFAAISIQSFRKCKYTVVSRPSTNLDIYVYS